MAEAFTKGSLKYARGGKGLLIVESPHNFAPLIDMPLSITVYSRTVDKYFNHFLFSLKKAFSGNKD